VSRPSPFFSYGSNRRDVGARDKPGHDEIWIER
jgi:hypothetical protein